MGLNYFGARFYDPVLGIWLTPDAYREFNNPYGRSGDPINNIDRDGNCELICAGIIIGATIGAYMGGSAANDTYNPMDWENDAETWEGIGKGAFVGGVAGAAGGAAALYATGAAATTTGYVGLGTKSGFLAATAGGAVQGGAAGLAAGFTGYSAGVFAANDFQNFNGYDGRDAWTATWQGGASGAVMGGLFAGAAYGLSDAYQWQTHKTVLNYGESMANPTGGISDFSYRVKMAEYVQSIEGSSNGVHSVNLETGTRALGNNKVGLSWDSGVDANGQFSADRFYTEIVHENGHLTDRAGLLKGSYSNLDFRSANNATRANAFHEYSATRYEMQHNYYKFWSSNTQNWIGQRAAEYHSISIQYGL